MKQLLRFFVLCSLTTSIFGQLVFNQTDGNYYFSNPQTGQLSRAYSDPVSKKYYYVNQFGLAAWIPTAAPLAPIQNQNYRTPISSDER